MPFFTYRQNNSGGAFEGPAIVVIIEADTAAQADSLAEVEGLYFDGVDWGRDCPCCGDRWRCQWDDGDGTTEPEINGTPWIDFLEGPEKRYYANWYEAPSALLVYKDGRRVVHDVRKEKSDG